MHTQGPWEVSEVRSVEGEHLVVGGEGQAFGLIAAVTEAEDARLIATLPDLLKALEPFAAQADTHGAQIPDEMFIDDYERDATKPWQSMAGIRVGDLRRARIALVAAKQVIAG